MILLPTVIQKDKYGEQHSDIMSYLLQNRIIFIDERISDETASAVVSQLLYLESQDPYKDIILYICSGGGSVTSGLSIIDFMDYVSCDICTIAHGSVASMAAVIFSNGTQGKRLVMNNSEIMIHEVKSVLGGKATDIEISSERIKELNYKLIGILAKNCGKSHRELEKYTNRDYFMDSQTAISFGIADKIVESNKY